MITTKQYLLLRRKDNPQYRDLIDEYEKEHIKGRSGQWLSTYSGSMFWILDPRPEDIDIKDIAHALSLICRYNGHINSFYSVAQHSVEVSYLVPRKYAFSALMHDATEAYVGDVIKPLKIILGSIYTNIEDNIMKAIKRKYHFSYSKKVHDIVKKADLLMLRTEMRDLTNFKFSAGDTIDKKLKALSPRRSKQLFLKRFHELYDGSK